MLCTQCVSSYTSLGIVAADRTDRLKEVYRQLVKEWHPDRYERDASMWIVASRKLTAINAAYAHISSCRINSESVSGLYRVNECFIDSPCGAWKQSSIEEFWAALERTGQRQRCIGLMWCSHSAWRKCVRCESIAAALTIARMFVGVAIAAFILISLFPDTCDDIGLWLTTLE